MASPEWLEIFRSYTPDELAAHITTLKGEISVYASQGHGDKNYTKDLAELRSQLSSAIRVQNERAATARGFGGNVTQVDFSGGG